MQKTQNEVKEVIKPYEEVIYRCILNGVQKTFELARQYGVYLKRTRANLCWEIIVNELKEKLPQNQFVFVEEYSSCLFVVKGKDVVFRVKKFNKDENSGNIFTQRLFEYNCGQLYLPLIAEPAALEIGYILNDYSNDVDCVSVQCRNGDWGYHISPCVSNNIVENEFNNGYNSVDERKQRFVPKQDIHNLEKVENGR